MIQNRSLTQLRKAMTMTTMTLQSLQAEIEALKSRVAELEKKEELRAGPKSERNMTEDDAKKVMIGELKDKSHRECAEILNLSYGQIYSARKGFTFKAIYKQMIEQQPKSK